jgi:hypothetical protein
VLVIKYAGKQKLVEEQPLLLIKTPRRKKAVEIGAASTVVRKSARKTALIVAEETERPATPTIDDGGKRGGRVLRNTPARLKREDSGNSVSEGAVGTPSRRSRKAESSVPLTAERRTRSTRSAANKE